MHTIIRICKITRIDTNRSLYQVALELIADDDQQRRSLTEHIRKEAGVGTGWDRLSVLLVKIGQFEEAEELYNVLLHQTTDEGEKAIYYNNLGYARNHQGDYEKAIWYHKKALEIRQKTGLPNCPLLAASYNNIGLVYTNMEEYSKALSLYERARTIWKIHYRWTIRKLKLCNKTSSY